MSIKFANITHIDQVREAIGDREHFRLLVKDGYTVANYVSIVAEFPDWNDGEHAAILRECRGMLFCNETGRVIRRAFEKFHNLGEREETRYENLDWSKFEVFDKLDGSMVAPFYLNGVIRWGTKAGITHMTPDIENFVARNPQYEDWARFNLDLGITPIFEYMAPQHRIVIDYGVENMVMLAARRMSDGQYADYDTLKSACEARGIPLVKRWVVDDHRTLVDTVKDLRGVEGVVILTGSGIKCKVKTLDYVDLHKNREAIARERYVAGLILNDRVDDVLSLVPDFVRPRLLHYTKQFLHEYGVLQRSITIQLHATLKEKPSRKDFALRQDLDHTVKWIGFKIFDVDIDQVGVHVDIWLKDIILRATNSETDFNSRVRNDLLKDKLPEWNIWDGTATLDE